MNLTFFGYHLLRKPHILSLVVLFDGTHNSHLEQDASYPSNVFKMFHCLAGEPIHCFREGLTKKYKDGHGNSKVHQRALYVPGIGTLEESRIDATKSAIEGIGLLERVVRAHVWLSRLFHPKPDRPSHQVEITLIGFSRGGYAARLLAEFICQVGLLLPKPDDRSKELGSKSKHVHYELSLLLLMQFLVTNRKQRILKSELGFAAFSEYFLRPEERDSPVIDDTEAEKAQRDFFTSIKEKFQEIPEWLQTRITSSPPRSSSLFKDNFKILQEWKDDDLEAQSERINQELAHCDSQMRERFQPKAFPIKALAVWDTVGAIGRSFYDTVMRSPEEDERGVVYPLNYCPPELHPNIQAAFHAVAIDEYRREFALELMRPPAKATNFRQVFFPGSHADVGGGYPFLSRPDGELENDDDTLKRTAALQTAHKKLDATYLQRFGTHHESGLSDIALCWMIDQLASIVHIPSKVTHFAKRVEKVLQADPFLPDSLGEIIIQPKYRTGEIYSSKFWHQAILIKPSPYAIAHCEQMLGGMPLSPRLFPSFVKSHQHLHSSFKLRSKTLERSYLIHIKRKIPEEFSLKSSPKPETYYHVYPRRINASL